jgi:hypothetical protein
VFRPVARGNVVLYEGGTGPATQLESGRRGADNHLQTSRSHRTPSSEA